MWALHLVKHLIKFLFISFCLLFLLNLGKKNLINFFESSGKNIFKLSEIKIVKKITLKFRVGELNEKRVY